MRSFSIINMLYNTAHFLSLRASPGQVLRPGLGLGVESQVLDLALSILIKSWHWYCLSLEIKTRTSVLVSQCPR